MMRKRQIAAVLAAACVFAAVGCAAKGGSSLSGKSQSTYVSVSQLDTYYEAYLGLGADARSISKCLSGIDDYDDVVDALVEYYSDVITDYRESSADGFDDSDDHFVLGALGAISFANGDLRQYTQTGTGRQFPVISTYSGTYKVNSDGMAVPTYASCTVVQQTGTDTYSIGGRDGEAGAGYVSEMQKGNELGAFAQALAVTSLNDRDQSVKPAWSYKPDREEYGIAGGVLGAFKQLYVKDNMLVVPQICYTLHAGRDGAFELRYDDSEVRKSGYGFENTMYFTKDGTWTDDLYGISTGQWKLLDDHLLVVASPSTHGSTGSISEGLEFRDIYYFSYFYIDLDTEEVCVPAYIRSDAAARLLQ